MNESNFLSCHYWEARYREKLTGWDVGYASPALTEYAKTAIKMENKILIPGAGYGHEAKFLFREGYRHVYVCEFSESAISDFKMNCPEFPDENIFKVDFFALEKTNLFDVILEQTFFCAIHPELRKKYFEKCHQLLSKGGKLAGVLFNTYFENPGPPFGGTEEEYIKILELNKWKILKWEACRNSIEPRKGREWWMELQKK